MQRRNCKYQGFTIRKAKTTIIVCEWDGENHNKKDCKKCDNYIPREKENYKNDKLPKNKTDEH